MSYIFINFIFSALQNTLQTKVNLHISIPISCLKRPTLSWVTLQDRSTAVTGLKISAKTCRNRLNQTGCDQAGDFRTPLSGEDIWIKVLAQKICTVHIDECNTWNDLRPFLKYLAQPFSSKLRSEKAKG